MNREQRRGRRHITRCPTVRKHLVLIHFNTQDQTQAVWHCPYCKSVGDVMADDVNMRLRAINPRLASDYELNAWAQYLAGFLAEASA